MTTRDDGLFVLEVPNSDCLTRRLCGTRWGPLDAPRHHQHFTAFGIPIACLSLPYSVLETLGNGNGEILTVTAHKAA